MYAIRKRLSPYIPGPVQVAASPMFAGLASMVTRAQLWRLARSKSPIIVGPWLSEVGFELLYWLPFLQWAATQYGLRKERLIVLSRGGAESWYRELCGHYIDVFDFFSLEEFRARNEQRWSEAGSQKQMAVNGFDQELIELVKRKLQLREADLLHPAMMYNLFKFYWQDRGSYGLLQRHTCYSRFPNVRKEGLLAELPAEYVAVRFYFRPSFPDTEENRLFVLQLVRRLAERIPVVVLNTGLALDDHPDCHLSGAQRMYWVEQLMTARNNLEIQTRVIARARAFFGTYGGLSYLAPFCGVPSIAFSSDERYFLPQHLEVAHRAFQQLGTSFLALHTRDVEMLRFFSFEKSADHITTGE